MSKEVQKYEGESFSMYVYCLLLWHLAYALTTAAYPSHGLHMVLSGNEKCKMSLFLSNLNKLG